MATSTTPPTELLRARRALEGVRGVALLADWCWYPAVSKWVLHCRLTPGLPANLSIPPTTDWYVLVGEDYPWGAIKFFPAKQNGIAQTFPHQSYNAWGNVDKPWRTGDLCLSTQVRILGRTGLDIEPHHVDQRLRWHFARALEWLCAAEAGALAAAGEPFELPVFPPQQSTCMYVCCEGRDTFATWQQTPEQAGLADIALSTDNDNLLVVKCFKTLGGKELLRPHWNNQLCSTKTVAQGIWWRLKTTPVMQPWQAPITWQDLRRASLQQDVDIDHLVRSTARFIRDGETHVAFIGFPIPVYVGAEPVQMCWQALALPPFHTGNPVVKGFRPGEKSLWQLDQTKVLQASKSIDWLRTENWHSSELSSRGRINRVVENMRVLLIGAGALGAVLAEQLVRAGVHRLVVVDGDVLDAGNLARHTLDLSAVSHHKASAVAARLNHISPHVEAVPIDASFPPSDTAHQATLLESNLVLDCTANDAVLQALSLFPWGTTKVFCSFSMGFSARRLFCFGCSGTIFPHSTFREMISPWLRREASENSEADFPREGVGCWHPVFPARVDDIHLLASIAVKYVDGIARLKPARPDLTVYQQEYHLNEFVGIRRVTESAD